MPTTQQQINYGTSANDGQGDPLRTAFIKTDDNFDAIWNAGPVGSNVTILNNIMSVVNANGNLAIAANGIGVIETRSSLVPRLANSYDLGSATLRYRSAWIGSGGLNVSGNLVVGGSYSISDLRVNTISSDDSSFVTVADGLTVSGDLGTDAIYTDNYFYANGAPFSPGSDYGNIQVLEFLASDFGARGANTVVTRGNLVATAIDVANIQHQFPIGIQTSGGGVWEFAGNILRGPQGGSWQSDADTAYFNSPANGFLNLTSLQNGNVVSELFMEHSFIRFFIDNGIDATWEMKADGRTEFPSYTFPYADGNAGEVLKTDGSGNLAWAADSSDYGNANVATFLAAFGSNNISTTGNVSAGNVNTGIITLTNGAQIRDTAGNAVAFGLNAGQTSQNDSAVAIGPDAGEISQGFNAVAVGFGAGANAQGSGAVSVGVGAGFITQGDSTVAIGASAGYQAQAVYAVAIGLQAGQTSQAQDAIAIGRDAGKTSQGEIAVAIGHLAGNASQGNAAVAIGAGAGTNTQGVHAVAIGTDTGATTQGNRAVAIGYLAGSNAQGTAAVAIGYYAGELNQGNNSIIINATDTALQQTTANTFTVAPIRNDVANVGNVLFYNTTSKEITYGNVISVAGNITGGNILTGGLISATGNITGNYILGNGSQLTSINAVTVDITDTNGLTTVYYPTFVENRTTAQIARADVDLTYRTDDNLLTVGNVSVTGNITGNTAGFAIGYRDIPQVSFTGNATIATADAGKHFYSTQSTDYILTIANNASQGFQTGAAITVINQGTGNITLAQGSGVTLYLTGNATSGNRTVSTFGMATLIKVATDTWFVSGAGVI